MCTDLKIAFDGKLDIRVHAQLNAVPYSSEFTIVDKSHKFK